MTTPCHHHHRTPTSTTTTTQRWHYLCHQNDDDDDAPPSRPYVNDDDETCPGHTTIAAQHPRPRPQQATSRNDDDECVQRDDERIRRDDAPSPSLLPSLSVSSSRATLRDDNDALSPSLPSCPHPYSYPYIPCILLVTNIYLFLLLLE